jgi:hypothetical protein
MSLPKMSQKRLWIGLLAAITTLQAANALEITFDTSLDTNGFFGQGTEARTVLEAAGGFFESLLVDDLDAISPGGSNSWQAFYEDPQTGAPVFSFNPSVAADSLTIYVGARDLGGPLGLATPGSAIFMGGDSAWQATLDSRGEGVNDFGPWGGSLAVADDVVWDYSVSSASAGKYSLYSNLLHEIGHVLGVGTSQSWLDQVDSVNDLFLGAQAGAEFGADVPLGTDEGHWADGTMSAIFGTGTVGEAALDPSLALGAFKPYTDLDVAGLGDIGWEIGAAPVPEPGASVLLVMTAVTFGRVRSRRR